MRSSHNNHAPVAYGAGCPRAAGRRAQPPELRAANTALQHDLIQRKRTEETLRFQARLLEAVEQAVIATDLEGVILHWIRFAETLYGWPAADVIGRNIVEVTPNNSSPGQANEIMARLQTGQYWSGEFCSPPGWHDLSGAGHRLTGARSGGRVGRHYWRLDRCDGAEAYRGCLAEERASLARRVEDRTADLSAANAELARAARLKDEFLASMSHELRTPLNAMLGLAEALQEESIGPINEQQPMRYDILKTAVGTCSP